MIKIRPARESDVALLPAIERSSGEIFRQIDGLDWIADDDVQSVEEHDRLLQGGLSLIAETDGFQIVAFLNAETFSDSLHIWQIAVHTGFQGHGIGKMLIEAAMHHAKAAGIAALTLTTFRDVPWNAPYYRRLGFSILNEAELTPKLRALLKAEELAGLPRDRRCAMRWRIN